MRTIETLIVGAGVAGLHLAQTLKLQKKSCFILEKSKGVGGRVASRRIENLGLDHGAPYLEKSFWDSTSLVHEVISDSFGFYLPGGMNRVTKVMSEDLLIEKNKRVTFIQAQKEKWLLKTEDGEEFLANQVVLTAPLPQSIELLEQNGFSKIPSVTYTKAIMGLFILEDEVKISTQMIDGHSLIPMTVRSLHPKGIVLRANPSVSENSFELSEAEGLKVLHQILQSVFKFNPKIKIQEYRKWKYVFPKEVLNCPFLEVAPSLYLIGDAFISPDAKGSLLSAEALASHLMN
jgi:renalase